VEGLAPASRSRRRGKRGEAGGRSAGTVGGDEFLLLFFLDWRRGTWRAAEMQKAPTPRECGMPEASAHFAGD
jgi:hypothetical protein